MKKEKNLPEKKERKKTRKRKERRAKKERRRRMKMKGGSCSRRPLFPLSMKPRKDTKVSLC